MASICRRIKIPENSQRNVNWVDVVSFTLLKRSRFQNRQKLIGNEPSTQLICKYVQSVQTYLPTSHFCDGEVKRSASFMLEANAIAYDRANTPEMDHFLGLHLQIVMLFHCQFTFYLPLASVERFSDSRPMLVVT